MSSNKLKVYLDTSIISHLHHPDAPEKMRETRSVWELFQRSLYDVYISTLVLEEIGDCPEPKRSNLLDWLSGIEYTLVDIDEKIQSIAARIIDMGILTEKSWDDCQHLAAAITAECDCIISWNFKHMVNIKTIRGVRAITNLEGFKPIEIMSPSALLEGDDNERKASFEP